MFRFFRRLIVVLFVLGLCAVGVVHFVLLEPAPRVSSMQTPEPKDVRAARDLLKSVSKELGAAEELKVLSVTPDQLEALATLGARFTPDYRGGFTVGPSVVHAEASVPLSWNGGTRWLNVSAAVPEFEGPLTAEDIRVGKLSIPPALAIWLARKGGNLVIGGGFGDAVFSPFRRMEIEPSVVKLTVFLEVIGDNNLVRNVISKLRGNDLPSADLILAYERKIWQAMESEELPLNGSFLPYLEFLLDLVRQNSTNETLANAYTAGIIGLAKVCGTSDFAIVIGGDVFDESADEFSASCDDVTFNDRIDSRRHFITAAALQAASNRGYSVTIGEFKELHDTVRSGGFDFTDISANNSGIRLSDVIMSGTVADLARILDRITAENDVIITFDDIPQILSLEEFQEQYGDIDSPAYADMLSFIESKIDTLAIYQ